MQAFRRIYFHPPPTQAFPHICFHPTLPQISKNTTKKKLPSVNLFQEKTMGHPVAVNLFSTK